MDSISLTLHLQYCVSRLYPDLAQHFSVSLPLGGTEEEVSGKASPVLGEDETQDLKSERVLLIEELEGSGRSAEERMRDPKHSQNATCPSFSLTKAGIPALQVHYQVRSFVVARVMHFLVHHTLYSLSQTGEPQLRGQQRSGQVLFRGDEWLVEGRDGVKY